MHFGILVCGQHSGTFPVWSHMTDELHYCNVINRHFTHIPAPLRNFHMAIFGVCHSQPFDVQIIQRLSVPPIPATFALGCTVSKRNGLKVDGLCVVLM